MSLQIAQSELTALLHDFYTLTGIRVVIFDNNFQEILAYPVPHCELCELVRQDKTRLAHCCQSDFASFAESRQRDKLVIYQCHAGLYEATAPIKSNGIVMGYMMFGQITENKHHLIESIAERFNLPADQIETWQNAARKVKQKNVTQIHAAAKIAEACTFYVLQKELVSLRHEKLADRMIQYIDENLAQDITARDLASKFLISRTKLYDILQKQLGMGIGEYIRRRRLDQARRLLISSEQKIVEVAEQFGFKDYANFSKAFKREFSLSPSAYRAKHLTLVSASDENVEKYL